METEKSPVAAEPTEARPKKQSPPVESDEETSIEEITDISCMTCGTN